MIHQRLSALIIQTKNENGSEESVSRHKVRLGEVSNVQQSGCDDNNSLEGQEQIRVNVSILLRSKVG